MIRRLFHFLSRRRFDTELDDEIQFHLETRAEELEQSGMSRRDAIDQSRREFGSRARMREDTRAAWRFQWIEDLFADLRYAARAFRRNPSFAATALACLALGIGANTTMFSLATEVLFSEPSCRDPQTLLHLNIGGNSHAAMGEYRFARDTQFVQSLAGEREEEEVNWRSGETTYQLAAVRVPLLLGRGIQPGDSDATVLSYSLWRSRFDGDPSIIGRKLTLDGRPHIVVGVTPRDHRTVTGFGFSPDLYVPAGIDDRSAVALYARVAPGTSRASVQVWLRNVSQELDRIYPIEHYKRGDGRVSSAGGLDRLRAEGQLMPLAAFFGVLMIVVGLVLMIACANVASLLLARASSRTHELAIRLSIGAGRGRIIRQLLGEALLLGVCGSAAGLLLNVWLTSMISNLRLTSLPVPIQFQIQPDWRLLTYLVLIAIGCTLACGLAPALSGTRAGLSATLKKGERQVVRRWSLRNALVVGQLAVCVVLLSAGLLFLRNLLHASSLRPGFDADHVAWSAMRLVPQAFTSPEKTTAFARDLLQRLRALPGVESAALTYVVPLNGNQVRGGAAHTDLNATPVHINTFTNRVTPDYFRSMGIAIVAGRDFREADRAGGERPIIINRSFAERVFGAANPLGHTFQFEDEPPQIVVAVVENSKYFTLGEENKLAMYSPYTKIEGPNLRLMIRSAAPRDLVKSINRTLLDADPTAAVETKPMRDALVFAMLPSRVGAAVLGSMGVLGLALASIGLYGVLLFAVSRRIREIGLRMALGATPRGILGMVLGESAALVAIGVSIGVALAILAVRPLAMFLIPEVRPDDPINFAIVICVLAAVALLATLSPARSRRRPPPRLAFSNLRLFPGIAGCGPASGCSMILQFRKQA